MTSLQAPRLFSFTIDKTQKTVLMGRALFPSQERSIVANDDHPFRGSKVRIELEPDLPAPLVYPAQGYQQYLLREHAKRCEQVTPPESARKLLDKDEWLQRQLTETQPWTPSLRSPIVAFSVLFLWSCYLAIANPWPRFNVLVPGTAFAVGALIIFLARRRNRRVIKLRAAYQAAGSTWVANPAKREEALAKNYADRNEVRVAAITELDDLLEHLEENGRHAIHREQNELAKKREELLRRLPVVHEPCLIKADTEDHEPCPIKAAQKDETEIAALQRQEIDLIARRKVLDAFCAPLKGEIREMTNALEAALAPDATIEMATFAEARRVPLAEKFRMLRFYAENPLKIPTRLPSAEEAAVSVQARTPAKAAGTR